MKITVGALSGAMLMATTAYAQTTTCQDRIFGSPQFGVECKTEQVKPINCGGSKFAALLAGCTAGEIKAASNRKAVGKLVADGKCDEARATALREGDFELAQLVSQTCQQR